MPQNILPMTFLLCPHYDIITWAGHNIEMIEMILRFFIFFANDEPLRIRSSVVERHSYKVEVAGSIPARRIKCSFKTKKEVE